MKPENTDTAVVIKDIHKTFGSKEVLKGVSAVIDYGERVCITGASGCGKTTLLKIICGITEPDRGTISGTRCKKSVVFQEPRLIPQMTAAANVELVIDRNIPAKERAKQAVEWLKLVELEADADKYPPEMSGGMQQRLAIARALAYDGEIMIFDEPFKAMDGAMKQRVISMCAEKTKGKTVIFVSHDEQEAKKFVSKILQMQDGILLSGQA